MIADLADPVIGFRVSWPDRFLEAADRQKIPGAQEPNGISCALISG